MPVVDFEEMGAENVEVNSPLVLSHLMKLRLKLLL